MAGSRKHQFYTDKVRLTLMADNSLTTKGWFIKKIQVIIEDPDCGKDGNNPNPRVGLSIHSQHYRDPFNISVTYPIPVGRFYDRDEKDLCIGSQFVLPLEIRSNPRIRNLFLRYGMKIWISRIPMGMIVPASALNPGQYELV